MIVLIQKSFNRINPDRLIPTRANKQNNIIQIWYRFNRINPDRLIPTATSAEPVVAQLSGAEWRNLFFEELND